MCGRFTLALDGQGLLRSYVATSDDGAGEWDPVLSVSPRTKAPVVREFLDEAGAAGPKWTWTCTGPDRCSRAVPSGPGVDAGATGPPGRTLRWGVLMAAPAFG